MSTYLLVVTVGLLCAQTHGWVGRYNWGQHSVDTSSCLQDWNKDLTPAVVQHRHQLGWSQRKCLSPPLSTPLFTLLHSPKSYSFTFFHSLKLFFYLCISLYSSSIFPHSFFSLSKASLFLCSPSCSLNPSSLPLLLPPPTCKSFPVTQLWFSANFSSLLEHISLCGTVALDSCDDFILPLLASVAVNSSGEWGLLRVASAVCYK